MWHNDFPERSIESSCGTQGRRGFKLVAFDGPDQTQACDFRTGEKSSFTVTPFGFRKTAGPQMVPDTVFADIHNSGEANLPEHGHPQLQCGYEGRQPNGQHIDPANRI
jgi:hypothetical protein